MTNEFNVNEASHGCAAALPNKLLASSSASGWTSVLLDHVEGEGACEPFETGHTPDLTIVVATQGEHLIEVLKTGRWRQAIYQAGAAGLTPGGEATRLRWSARPSSPTFRSAHLYLPQALLHEAADHFRRAGQAAPAEPLSALVLNEPAVARAIHLLLDAMEAGAPDLYAQQVSLSLVTHLLSTHGSWRDPEDSRDVGVIADARLARTVAFMSAHVGDDLTIDRLASEAAMSKFNFARSFRRQTGRTPHGFLLDLRLAAARRMLATTDLPVGRIGVMCGFPRPAYFATSFKQHFGVSPREIRRRIGH